MPELRFATGFYESFSKPLAAQECINLIPIVPQTNALSGAALIGTPGIDQIAMLSGKNRGAHVFKGRDYRVNGTSLFRINRDFSVEELGQINGSERVSMADNGTQLCIVVPYDKGYIFTENPDTLTEITAPGYTDNPSKFVVYIDSYFVHITDNVFFISNANNGLAYDPLDFATAEVDPDKIIGAHVSRNQLFIFGSQTIELFQNIGGADFPFQRINGAVIPKGLKAINSVIEFDNSFVFLGAGVNEGAAIWKWIGGNVQKISNSAIDTQINKYSDAEIKSCFVMSYAQNGSYFVIFSFIKNTFVYDATASILQGRPVWHERRSGLGLGTRWRVNSISEVYGQILVADAFDGRVGRLDDKSYEEYGEIITRSFSTAPFNQQNNDIFVHKIEMTVEPGTSDITPLNLSPQLRMSFSDDGGFTFSNEIPRSMGRQGHYNTRLIWWRQGKTSTSRILKFKIAEKIKVAFLKLTAEWEVEES